MQYRFAFMDALRRVTGEDLFTPFAERMDARLALASVAGIKDAGHDQDNETVVHEPSYGQINYYAPVLLALARFYRRPLYHYLASLDRTMGADQQSRYITIWQWMLTGEATRTHGTIPAWRRGQSGTRRCPSPSLRSARPTCAHRMSLEASSRECGAVRWLSMPVVVRSTQT